MAAAGMPVRLRPGTGRMSRVADSERSPRSAFGPDGLVPAVVQDVADGRVLMVAWMDARGPGCDARERRGPFPLAISRPALAQGRDERQRPAARPHRGRLRRRCPPRHRRSRRTDLSSRDAELFRRRRRTRRARHPGFRLARGAVGDDRRPRCDPTRRLVHRRPSSAAASTRSPARSPRRPPRSSSPPRTTLSPRPPGPIARPRGRPGRRDRRPALPRARPARRTRPAAGRGASRPARPPSLARALVPAADSLGA